MPNFPSINTLTQKPTLTGDEVIQISATEKTTLHELINQLGFSGSSILTGLNTGLSPSMVIPTQNDNLLSALGKIIARAGSDKLFILPVPDLTDEVRLIIAVVNKDGSSIAGYIARLSITYQGITLKYVPCNEPFLPDHSTVADLDNFVDGSTDGFIWNFNGDKELENDTLTIVFNPGDIIYHTGSQLWHIIIPMGYWYDQSSIFKHYTSTIVTQVNVTKSMFNRAKGGDLSKVTYLFMDDFDANPGTNYQCITIQRVKRAGSGIVLMVNKCGYTNL